MTRRPSRSPSVLFLVPCLALALPAASTEITPKPPETTTPPGPRPSEIVKRLAEQPPPALTGTGDVARKNAQAFIDWAAASTKPQAEMVRKAVAEAGRNPEIMEAFCQKAFDAQHTDHSRALVVLSLIGEARSKYGEECLVKFMALPFPEKGTLVDGEIVEQTALATLQAKAIDGIAYLRTEAADKIVLEAVAKHPSRIVRAEAIAAYLWNHEYSERARETLRSFVRKDELIFLDRVVRREGEPKESFNRKLEAYLKAHPELLPPAPEKARPKPKPTAGAPPAF
jgi:hypothetical protein